MCLKLILIINRGYIELAMSLYIHKSTASLEGIRTHHRWSDASYTVYSSSVAGLPSMRD